MCIFSIFLFPLGFFRDRIGSYDGLYFVLGVYSFLVSCMWVIISLVRLYKVNKKYRLK